MQDSAHAGAGGPHGHHGKHRDFDKACEAAYEAAKAAHLTPPYVVDVKLDGSNPFGGYIVSIRP
jgi:hypothetical protein